MIRAMGLAQMMLFASATIVHGQGSKPQPPPPQGAPPQVLSQTGTMYDGNNANLQLPAEPDRYWVDRWAAPISPRSAAPASTANSVSGGPGAGRR